MALLSEQVRGDLRDRFAERLSGPVRLTLRTRPGTGRLILPSGLGCATCDDAREIAEALAGAAPDLVGLEVIDVSAGAPDEAGLEVPLLELGFPGEAARIRWQGLPAGYEFATVVDAIERVSTGDHGLAPESLEALGRLQGPVEIMVFATPT